MQNKTIVMFLLLFLSFFPNFIIPIMDRTNKIHTRVKLVFLSSPVFGVRIFFNPANAYFPLPDSLVL